MICIALHFAIHFIFRWWRDNTQREWECILSFVYTSMLWVWNICRIYFYLICSFTICHRNITSLMWEGPQVSADLERREEIRFIGSIKLLSGVALGCGGLSACWSLAWRWEREPCHWLLGSSPGLVTNYFDCWIFSWGLILCLEKYRVILIISQLPERNQMSEVTAAWVRLTFRWSSGTDLMIEAGTSGDNTNKTETCQGECL